AAIAWSGGNPNPSYTDGYASTAASWTNPDSEPSSSQPVRAIRDRADARPTASVTASVPHPSGPARTRATSGRSAATWSKARTNPGRSLRGSAVPTASTYRAVPGGRCRPAAPGTGAGNGGTPEWTARTRSGSAPKASTTSAATKAEG